METEEKTVWSKDSKSMFEQFAVQLDEYSKTQQLPALGDQDVKFFLELQQNRMKQKNLRLEYTIESRELASDQMPSKNIWGDALYQNEVEWKSCGLTETFFRDNKKIYEKEGRKVLYQTITYVKEGCDVSDEPYVCPNCGAVSTVKELEAGCSYCGTHFIMQDLFPKVTNFFFLEDYGLTKKELKHDIWKYILPWMAVFSVIDLAVNLITREQPLWLTLLLMIPSVAMGGCVLGYLNWAVVKMIGLFSGAAKSVSFLTAAIGTPNKFENQMQQYSPEFSYEYFSDKVVSLLKMIAFAEDAQDLPNYSGRPVANLFSDIVEMSFFGIVLKQFAEKNGTVFVTIIVHMDDLYEKNGHFSKKSDKFRVKLYRRIDKSFNYHFSIKKVACKNCSGSFDATKNKTCPYCGTPYEIEDDDWIVTEIKKV